MSRPPASGEVPADPDLGFLRRRPPHPPRGIQAPAVGVGGAAAPFRAGTPGPPSAPAPPPPVHRPPPAAHRTPARIPTAPDLRFIRRRAPRPGISSELVRTGNTALDLSATAVRTVGSGTVTPPPAILPQRSGPLRGRTVLDAEHPSVTVAGEQASAGALQMQLTWSTQPTDPRSIRAGLRRSTDLHVGCLWQMDDGEAGVVQSLGDSTFAASGGTTVIRLGPRSETDGETLTVSLAHIGALRRLLVYAYAYTGRPEWDALAATLTLRLRGGASVQVRLDGDPGGSSDAPPGEADICALLSLHRVGGTLVLRREAAFLLGRQAAVAEAYGWDLPWASGRTVPVVR